MNKKKNRGFSLVELIVVVAIMAVLVGVLAPSLLRYVEKTRIQKDVSAVAEVREAVIIAMADETIFTDTPDASTVIIEDGNAIVVNGPTGTALADELEIVIGDDGVDFTSNAMDGETVVLVIEVDGTNVTCSFDSTNAANTVSDATALAGLGNIN